MKKLEFGHLVGQWRFERYISAPELHINGNARFTRLSQNCLSYNESGTYIINGIFYDFFQKRSFMYDKNSLSVFKNDRSLLHHFYFEKISFSSNCSAQHTHQCILDTYQCSLFLKSEGCFEMNYEINSPNKNYKISTLYTKD